MKKKVVTELVECFENLHKALEKLSPTERKEFAKLTKAALTSFPVKEHFEIFQYSEDNDAVDPIFFEDAGFKEERPYFVRKMPSGETVAIAATIDLARTIAKLQVSTKLQGCRACALRESEE
jgi:hypothetical protein